MIAYDSEQNLCMQIQRKETRKKEEERRQRRGRIYIEKKKILMKNLEENTETLYMVFILFLSCSIEHLEL